MGAVFLSGFDLYQLGGWNPAGIWRYCLVDTDLCGLLSLTWIERLVVTASTQYDYLSFNELIFFAKFAMMWQRGSAGRFGCFDLSELILGRLGGC
jgi:hypothetical protein